MEYGIKVLKQYSLLNFVPFEFYQCRFAYDSALMRSTKL